MFKNIRDKFMPVDRQRRYSIRKLSVGAASVLLGTFVTVHSHSHKDTVYAAEVADKIKITGLNASPSESVGDDAIAISMKVVKNSDLTKETDENSKDTDAAEVEGAKADVETPSTDDKSQNTASVENTESQNLDSTEKADTWNLSGSNSKTFDNVEIDKVDTNGFKLEVDGQELDTSSIDSNSFQWVDKDGNPVASNPKNVGTYYIDLTDAAKEKLKEANKGIDLSDLNTVSEYQIKQATASASLKGYNSQVADNTEVETEDINKNNKIYVEVDIPGVQTSQYNLKDGDYTWYDDNNKNQKEIDAPSTVGTYYLGLTDQGKDSVTDYVNSIAGLGLDDQGNEVPNVTVDSKKNNAAYYIYDEKQKLTSTITNDGNKIIIPDGTIWTPAGWTRANPDYVAKSTIAEVRNYAKDNKNFKDKNDHGLNVGNKSNLSPTEFGTDISSVVIDKDDIKVGNKILLATVTVANDYATTPDQELPLSVSSLEDGKEVTISNTNQVIGTISVTQLDDGEIDFWLNVTDTDTYAEDVTITAIRDYHTGYINHKNDYSKLGQLKKNGEPLHNGSTIHQRVYTASGYHTNSYTLNSIGRGLKNVPNQGSPTIWLNASGPSFGANHVNPALGLDHDGLQGINNKDKVDVNEYTKVYLIQGNNIDYSNLSTFEREEISPVDNGEIKFESSDAVPDEQGNLQLLDKNKKQAIKLDDNLSAQDLIAQTPDGQSAYSLQDNGGAMVVVKVKPDDTKLSEQEITDYVKTSQYYNLQSNDRERTLTNTLNFYKKTSNQALRTAVMIQAGLKDINKDDSWGIIADITPDEIKAGVHQSLAPVYYSKSDPNGKAAVFRKINITYEDETGKELSKQPRIVLVKDDSVDKDFALSVGQEYELVGVHVTGDESQTKDVDENGKFTHTIYSDDSKNQDITVKVKKINNLHPITYTVIDEDNKGSVITKDTSLGISVSDSDLSEGKVNSEAIQEKLDAVVARFTSQGYELVENNFTNDSFKSDDYDITIKLKHGKTVVSSDEEWPAGVKDSDKVDLNKSITRKITVIGLPTTGNSTTQVATFTRSAVVDNVTNKIVGYGDEKNLIQDENEAWKLADNTGWSSYSVSGENITTGFKIKSITVNGENYDAVTKNGKELTGVDAVTPNVSDSDINVVITYEGESRSVTYHFVDDDNNGDQVGGAIVLNGTTGKVASVKLTVPEGYVLADDQKLPTTYTFKASGRETIDVHLKHATEKVSQQKTVYQTIHYQYSDGKKALDDYSTSKTITDSGTRDLVTDKITWNNQTAKFDRVNVPTIDGYSPSQDVIDEQEANTDIEETITYTPIAQSIKIEFVDDDSNGKEVLDKQVTGTTGQTADINLTVPENYTLADGQLIPESYTFKAKDNNPITIHLKHKIIENVDKDHIPNDSNLTESNFTKIVTRTITAEVPSYDDTGKLVGVKDQDLSQRKVLTRTGSYDQVTKKITWHAWSTDTFSEVRAPKVEGYTPSRSTIAAEKATANYVDPKIVITYTANTQSVKIKFVDDDNEQTQVGDSFVKSGKTDQKVTINLSVPKNYELVEGQALPDSYTFKASDNKDIIIHLKHATKPASRQKTISQTIHYQYSNGEKAHDDHHVSKDVTDSGTKDLVTGNTTWDNQWSKAEFNAVTSPIVAGYTPSQSAIDKQTSDEDLNIEVTYTANEQSVKIKFVDDDNEQTQVGDSIVKFGKTDQIITDFDDVKLPENYRLVDNREFPTSYQFTFATNQEIIIHLKHKQEEVSEDRTVTRTITDNVPGEKAVPTTQTAHFTRTGDKDLVTGNITWNDYTSDDHTWDAYSPVGKAGYTASTVSSVVVKPTDTDTSLEINYTPNDQENTITIVDNDANGKVLETITINGKTDQATEWQIDIPENYELVAGQSSFGSYQFTGEDQTPITVNVTHKHQKQPNEVKTVTRTIVENIPGKEAKETVQTVNFTRTADKDLVTGEITYSDWSSDDDNWLTFNVDQIDGYTASQDVISDSKVTSNMTDQTINITYTAKSQTITYKFVDDDNNGGQVGEGYVVAGVTDQTVKTNLAVPENYELANGQTLPANYTFKASSNNDVLIHLKHQIKNISSSAPDPRVFGLTQDDLNKIITRTITFETPHNGEVTTEQKLQFVRDAALDLVTGVITYGKWSAIGQASFTAIQPNKVAGYTPSIVTIAQADLTSEQVDNWLDPDIHVTYVPNPQSVIYRFIDDDSNEQVGKDIVLNGKTDAVINLADAGVVLPSLNYNLVGNLPSEYKFSAENKVQEIHLKHATEAVSRQKTISQTIHYQYSNGEKAHEDHQVSKTITDNGIKDLVTGEITWDDQWSTAEFATVLAPLVYGYTPSQSVIGEQVVSENIDDVITYVANDQNVAIKFIDDDNGQTQVGKVIIKSGKTDQVITDFDDVKLLENYDLAGNQELPSSYQFTFAANQEILVHLKHRVKNVSENHEVTRTIIDKVPGQDAVKTLQTAHFTRTGVRDLVTNSITWNDYTRDDSTWDEYLPIGKAGYTASAGASVRVKPTDADTSLEINYTPNKQENTVTIVDDDADGKVLRTTTITGKTDQSTEWQIDIPENYELVDGQSNSGSYQFTGETQTPITVHVAHKHQEQPDEVKTVTRTIIDNIPGQEARETVQTVNFTRSGDKDLVTGEIAYSDWQSDQTTWAEYQPEKVLAYTANINKIDQVDNVTPSTSDQTIKIDYTENKAVATLKGRDERLNLDEIDLNLYHMHIGEDRISLKKLGVGLEDLEFIDENGQSGTIDPGDYTVKLKQSAMDKIQKQFPDYHLSFDNKASFVLLNQERIQYVDKNGNVLEEVDPIIGHDQEKKSFRPHLRHGWQFISFPKSITIDGGKTKVVVDHIRTKVTADDPKTTAEKLPDNTEMNYPSGLGQDDLNREVTRTIVVNVPNSPKTIVQKASWTRDAEVDEVTGEVTYDDWQLVENGLTSYEAPVIEGYRSNIETVSAETPTPDSKYDDIQIEYVATVDTNKETDVDTTKVDHTDTVHPTSDSIKHDEISSNVNDNSSSYDVSDIGNINNIENTYDVNNISNINNTDDIENTTDITVEDTSSTDMDTPARKLEPLGLSLYREARARTSKNIGFSGILAKSVLPETKDSDEILTKYENIVKPQIVETNNEAKENMLPETGNKDNYVISILGLLLSGISLSGLFLKRKE